MPQPSPRQGRILVRGVRHATSTERNPEKWLAATSEQGHGLVEQTRLTQSQEADEMLLMGLRLGEGLDLDRLARIGGVVPSDAVIGELTELGLVERIHGGTRIRATGNGRFVLNAIVARLSKGFQSIAYAD